MRISDWSSDVCSSDLRRYRRRHAARNRGGLWPWRGSVGGARRAPLGCLARWLRAAAIGASLARHDHLHVRYDRQAQGRPPCACDRRTECHNRGDYRGLLRSEEHTSELQSLMRISYAVFCLKKKKTKHIKRHKETTT